MSLGMRRFQVHTCELPFEDTLPKASPFSSKFYKLIFNLSRYRIVKRTSKSIRIFRSNRAILRERLRQLNNPKYKYSIHPFSTMAQMQRYVMFVVWLFNYLVGTTYGSFWYTEIADVKHCYGQPMIIVFNIVRLIMIADIITRFYLGYVKRKTQKVVLDRKKIAKHYLMTFFFVDVAFPLSGLLLLICVGIEGIWRIVIFQLIYVQLGRLGTFLKTFNHILKKCYLREITRTWASLCLVGLLMVHWWACVLRLITVTYDVEEMIPYYNNTWFKKMQNDRNAFTLINKMLKREDPLSYFYPYLTHVAIVLCHFVSANRGQYTTNDRYEMIVLSFVLISGLIFYIVAVARILEFFRFVNISESKFEDILYQAQQYMVIKRYPRDLRRRVVKYYTYKYDRKFFHEDLILDGLSEHLRMEVILYTCKNIVSNLSLFKGLSKASVGCLLSMLNPEFYLPKDVIMTLDQEDKHVYFILHGTCSIQLLSNLELVHREDGDFFSNAGSSLWEDYKDAFLYKVVAAEPCEIYTITSDDVTFCCKAHPELADRFRFLSRTTDKTLKDVYSTAVERSQFVETMDIIAELRRGRILSQGRKRDLFV